MARRIARIASRPCRRASAASEVANKAEHQPPFRPDAPNPATSRSKTATRSEGSASARAYAVQSPVNPTPTMQTSTSRSSVSAGRGGSGTGIASHQRRGAVDSPIRLPALQPTPRFGQHVAQRGGDEVDLLLATDERRRQLHHGIAPVVGPADQPGLEQGSGKKAAQQPLGLVVVEGKHVSLSLTSSIP